MFGKDDLVIANIKGLALDMINEAGSGHPGIALSAAPILYALYADHLNISTTDDKWLNRDRFIMSAGHGSALLYATLHMAGYDISIDELKRFRRLDSKTPGHPELNVTPGVDMSTGPLGQGFAASVGIALGERYLRTLAKSYLKDESLINYYTYVLCSDGDLMEGVSYEAASFAGTQKLGKLIVLYDSNNVSLDGETKITFTEDVLKRFAAMGWHTELVKDGTNFNSISKAISKAKRITDQPSLIEVKTVLGNGSINAGKNIVHGKPLEKSDITLVKNKLGIKDIPFSINEEARSYFKNKINKRVSPLYSTWASYFNQVQKLNSTSELISNLLNYLFKGQINIDFNALGLTVSPNHKEELRLSNYRIMNAFVKKTPFILGGSADLSSSTKTIIIDEKEDFKINSYESPLSKNIFFGVREHAMGAILNGLALAGLRPFGSTFLVFADYLKPALRMSALMNLPVTYIFTHDSISIGEDGPSHEPVEELTMLRSIPNFRVYRPGDIIELIGCWEQILTDKKPCALVISKNELELVNGTNREYTKYGAYMVKKETNRLDGILIATGSELRIASLLAKDLANKGLDLRVVSMPSLEAFNKVDLNYQKLLLPENIKTIAIEAGSSYSWYQYVKDPKYLLNINTFGYSGHKDEVLEKLEFDYESLKIKIEKLLR
jgi:transketolase